MLCCYSPAIIQFYIFCHPRNSGSTDARDPKRPIKAIRAIRRQNLKTLCSLRLLTDSSSLRTCCFILNLNYHGSIQRRAYKNVLLREQIENLRGMAVRRRLFVHAGKCEYILKTVNFSTDSIYKRKHTRIFFFKKHRKDAQTIKQSFMITK